jgi:hypothetical protein
MRKAFMLIAIRWPEFESGKNLEIIMRYRGFWASHNIWHTSCQTYPCVLVLWQP